MELSQSPFVIDSAVSPADTGNCESSTDDSTSNVRRQTTTKPSRNREPLEPLIVAALRSAPGKRMLVTDIYRYIETHSDDYRDVSSTQPSSSTSTSDNTGQPSRTKEPAWKIHVRHILSVRRDVFPLTTEKDGKRRGRFHALDELQYANRLAAKAQRTGNSDVGGLDAETPFQVSTTSEPARRRHRRRNHRENDGNTPPCTHVSCFNDFQCINVLILEGQDPRCKLAVGRMY